MKHANGGSKDKTQQKNVKNNKEQPTKDINRLRETHRDTKKKCL